MTDEQQPPAADNEGAGGQPPAEEAPATPAATEAGQGAGTKDESSTETIRNPEAYWKAQAEKYERLTAKQTEEVQKLQSRLASFDEQQREQIENELKAMREETEKAQAEVDAERKRLTQLRIGTELGLPATLAARLQGETEDDLRADAEALAKTLPKSAGQTARMGNPAGESGLTMDEIKTMTPEQYIARRDEVQATLRSQRKK